jgi:hypothetical protein
MSPGKEMLSTPSPSPREPTPHPLAGGADEERGKRPPVVGSLVEAWRRVWSAISSFLERLR